MIHTPFPLQVQLAPVRQCSRTQARKSARSGINHHETGFLDQDLDKLVGGAWRFPFFLLTFYVRTIGLVYFS